MLGTLFACPALAYSQHVIEDLPDSPGAMLQAISPDPQSGSPKDGTATAGARIDGVVQDVQGNPVPEAQVVLTTSGKLGERRTVADSMGVFHFSELPPAQYRLILSANGMATYTSLEFFLKAGQTLEVPKIALLLATTSSVEVMATPDQVAEAQVHEQEKQRVLGVFPNFYTSYIWKAEPMTAKQKYGLAVRSTIDPVNFLGIAAAAGAEQYYGTYPGYGPGIAGYGKRFAASFGDNLTSRFIGSAILPSVLHQDPRYFYQGSGGARSRTLHALAFTFICRGDNGRDQPNYSHLLGSLAAGGIANAYHPASSRGVGLTFQTFGITIGTNMAGNLVREFVLRGFVPSVPAYANGKP